MGPWRRRLTVIAVSAALALSACIGVAEDQAENGGGGGGSRAPAKQVSFERVIQASYNTIASRYVDPPDFRKVTLGALRGLNKLDTDMVATDRGDKLQLRRRAQVVGDFPTPTPEDSRGWARLTTDLMGAAFQASPTLQQAGQDKMLKASLDGALETLDKHSRYSDPSVASDNRFSREGSGGIGVTIRGEGEFLIVGSVFPDMPAVRAGVQVDDRIVSIDGQPTAGWSERQLIDKVRGPVDSTLRLGLLRPKDGATHNVRLTRELIIPPTVVYERGGNIAYIKLSGFNQATVSRLQSALEQARKEIGNDMSGIVLDMRGNPGGLLEQAVAVSNLFLGEGVVASTRGRHPDSGHVYRATSRAVSTNVPMIILINGRSASAAEIVAAALQDRGRAVVVGTNSYGKATVQTVVRLPNDGELTLTWSRLHAPSGYSWHEIGVMPTVCTADLQSEEALGRQFAERTQRMAELVALWHADKRPSTQRLEQLRKTCSPSDISPDRDKRIAERLLLDTTLYSRAISVTQAALAQR